MNSEIKILIIEDEAPIQRFLTVLISSTVFDCAYFWL